MTDKELKAKILAEIERLRRQATEQEKWAEENHLQSTQGMYHRYIELCDKIFAFINSIPEEPVKIKKGCKYCCLSDMVNKDTGNIAFVRDKIYLAPKDNTLVSEENGWLCDTSENASNFELVEEPVSNSDWLTELQEKLDNATPEQLEELWDKYHDDEEEPVGDDLKEAADNALESITDQYDIISVGSCLEMFRLGTKWQKQEIINRAVEWLKDHKEEVKTEDNGIAGWIPDEFIEDFKKALEE